MILYENRLNLIINFENVLFFDLDGVLVDTDLANYLSYKDAVKKTIEKDIDNFYNPKKRFNREVLKKIFPDLAEIEYKKIIQLKNELYNKYLPETKLNTSIVEIVEKYYKTNKTILITNCREDRALVTLEYYGLIDKFVHKFYRKKDDNEHKINKYENALSYLRMSPELVLVFENDESDINAAIHAGIPYDNIIIVDFTI